MTQTIDDIFATLPSYFSEPTPASDSTFADGVNPASLGSGELQGNTKVQAGYLKSGNYAADVRGWKIDAEGNAEFNDGVFRGDFEIGGTLKTIDDVSEIQHALDEVETAGGGTVFLQNGTYVLTADIFVPAGVALRGVSRDGAIIDCDGTYGVYISGEDAYLTGTVTINDGDTQVVGSGTTWTAAMIGRSIYLGGAWYEITARTDNTHITIASAYSGDNLSGSAYAIANVNNQATLGQLTVTGATGSGVIIRYALEPTLDDLYIYGCGLGLDYDFVQFPRLYVSSQENDVNANLNFVSGFKIDYCEFSNSLSGAGIVFINCIGATLVDTAMSDNATNGASLTDCTNIGFSDFDASGNGAKGIELVSGNSGIKFHGGGDVSGNGSDGIKITATSDDTIISNNNIHDNAGYGVNIAAASCDNTLVSNNPMSTNSSGNLNDLGTNSVISSNPGV